MQMLGKDAHLKDVEPHQLMVFFVFDLFTRQAQPKLIKECKGGKVVFDLRNNISNQQMSRLILEPLARDMPEYEWELSVKEKTLTATHKKVKANAKKDTKANKSDASGKAES